MAAEKLLLRSCLRAAMTVEREMQGAPAAPLARESVRVFLEKHAPHLKHMAEPHFPTGGMKDAFRRRIFPDLTPGAMDVRSIVREGFRPRRTLEAHAGNQSSALDGALKHAAANSAGRGSDGSDQSSSSGASESIFGGAGKPGEDSPLKAVGADGAVDEVVRRVKKTLSSRLSRPRKKLDAPASAASRVEGEASALSGALAVSYSMTASEQLDLGFRSLRSLHALAEWLRVNRDLHELSLKGASVEEGASLISDAISRNSEHGGASAGREDAADQNVSTGSRSESICVQLDRLAETLRESKTGLSAASADAVSADAAALDALGGGSRLRLLSKLNAFMFVDLGFRGEYGDVLLNSSLESVLTRRRGLPILLCTVYAAVARRLGLRLGFVNFPNTMLLRLDAVETSANESGDAASESERFTPFETGSVDGLKRNGGDENSEGGGGGRRASSSSSSPSSSSPAAAAVAAAAVGVRAGSFAPSELCGLWMAWYAGHGPEVLDVHIGEDGALQ
eukprot:6203819-Pleurochrysis_carterae.AAC.1